LAAAGGLDPAAELRNLQLRDYVFPSLGNRSFPAMVSSNHNHAQTGVNSGKRECKEIVKKNRVIGSPDHRKPKSMINRESATADRSHANGCEFGNGEEGLGLVFQLPKQTLLKLLHPTGLLEQCSCKRGAPVDFEHSQTGNIGGRWPLSVRVSHCRIHKGSHGQQTPTQ
jgi:hypothetical protein